MQSCLISKNEEDLLIDFFPSSLFLLISTVNCPLSTVNCQLSTVNCQLSTVNSQLPTVNYSKSLLCTEHKFDVPAIANTHI